MKTKEGLNLLAPVPKTIWWKIKLYMASVLWFLYSSETKKTWKEMYYGFVPHKCEFDYKNKVSEKNNGAYFPCKHYGCNIVSVYDENDKLIF